MSSNTGIEWTDATWSPLRVRVREDAADIARQKGYTSLIQIAEKMKGRVGQHCERVSEGCKNCLTPDTPILYSDLSWRPIGEVNIGDELLAFDENCPGPKQKRRWRISIVENVWWLRNWSHRVICDDREVISSDTHRWLSAWNRWQYTTDLSSRRDDMGLTQIRSMPVVEAPKETESYRRGYISGMTLGDGTFRFDPSRSVQSYWRVALSDYDALDRLKSYLSFDGIDVNVRPFHGGSDTRKEMRKVEARSHDHLRRIEMITKSDGTNDYARGWLAGFFDAEGCHSDSLRIAQVDTAPLHTAIALGKLFGFRFEIEDPGSRHANTARLIGDVNERLRFFAVTRPAIQRKYLKGALGLSMEVGSSIVRTVERGPVMDLVDIQTSTRTFIANGLATHNCYSGTWQARCLKVNGTGLPFDRRSRDLVKTIVDEKALRAPLHWKAHKRIFVENQSDLFGEWVPAKHIDLAFAVMSQSPEHTFQILTKRPEQMLVYLTDERTQDGIDEAGTKLGWCHANVQGRWPLPNVWLGVSVEDQATADARIPLLLQTPAAKRFVSYEPALGPVDLSKWLRYNPISWLICGGESGPGARPMHPDWPRSIRDQCVAAGVPFFFKQWGEYGPVTVDDRHGAIAPNERRELWIHPDGRTSNRQGVSDFAWPMVRVGKKKAGALLDGREWRQFPL